MNGYKIGCCFSRDGQFIATGSSTGYLTFYDYHTSHRVESMKVFNKSACLNAQFHPLYNSTVAVCSWSGKVAILQWIVCYEIVEFDIHFLTTINHNEYRTGWLY